MAAIADNATLGVAQPVRHRAEANARKESHTRSVPFSALAATIAVRKALSHEVRGHVPDPMRFGGHVPD
ncbi:MAG: hypothetical protein ACR2J5_15585, partial [Geodermatophilaceae bacterium]